MKFVHAVLMYGSSVCPVRPNEGLPIPEVFDWGNPVECAKKIFAMMSNASGGHHLKDCKVSVNVEFGSANLFCNGAHIFYSYGRKYPLEEMMEKMKSTVTYDLGSVVTDQYGDGWKRAKWY